MLLNRGENGFGTAPPGGDLPDLPEGFAFVVDGDGNYLLYGDDTYVIAEI